MKRFLLIILLFVSVNASASHIVGGEFEVLYLSPNFYRVNFILYFDLNGDAGAKDPSVDARIFRKFDNFIMDDITLFFDRQEIVSYTQPVCARSELKTLKLVYTNTITMSDSEYNHPDGYYIAWERCCRNYNVNSNNPSAPKLVNIVSTDPNGNPNSSTAAGQTFYLEFPPVVKNGVPFINSTPQLFPPLSDFACAGQPFYADFSGSDIDGDSLYYEMVTPLNTHTSQAIPQGGPGSAPYAGVTWKFPYSLDNITGGPENLRITPDGILRVIPGNTIGLYVFAVKCSEFRNGVKIGEVRRDFQMYVLDCPIYSKPEIKGRTLSDDTFKYDNNMSVTFTNDTPDENRCIEVEISDKDIFTEPVEYVKIRVIPIGFKADISDILPEVTNDTLSTVQPAVKFRVCFEKCPFVNRPFQIGIIASDNSCAVPMLDTLKVTVNIIPPANRDPRFTTVDVTETVDEALLDINQYPIEGIDEDGDSLTVTVLTNGFDIDDAGIDLPYLLKQKALYRDTLFWDANCVDYDYTQQNNFQVTLLLDDDDLCKFNKPDTMYFDLTADLPDNVPPKIGVENLTPDQILNGIDRRLFESLNFGVYGTDNDNDQLELVMEGVGFDPVSFGVVFPGDSDRGYVTSPFDWLPDCEKANLKAKDDFNFRFIVKDWNNKCRFKYADTLNVFVNLLPPLNDQPVLAIQNLNPETPMTANELEVTLGQDVRLNIVSTDPNATDHLRLVLLDADGTVPPEGYVFQDAQGNGTITAPFTWLFDCSQFQNGVYENDYTFRFRTYDDRCFNVLGDTVELGITVKDVAADFSGFIPPNIITPNNDGCNDFFALEGFDSEVVNQNCPMAMYPTLPVDNCVSKFNSIRIYNRWGKQVFESNQRNFRWHGNDAGGVYFYTIMFTDPESADPVKEYKGTITVFF